MRPSAGPTEKPLKPQGVTMDKDPCHELEMAQAGLAGVVKRLAGPLFDGTRKALETTADGLRKEIEWWQPRCEHELREEEL